MKPRRDKHNGRGRSTPRLRFSDSIALSVCAVLCVASSEAFGQSAADRAAAEALYREGRELAASGSIDTACLKFEESQSLDPGIGTLIAIAQCHERAGRLASAWAEYNEVLVSAQKAKRADRVKLAKAALDRLERKLPSLRVRLSSGAASTQGLQVYRDDTSVGPGALDTPIPVDVGEHEVSAIAPGKKRWSQRVQVKESQRDVTVEVPALDEQAPAPETTTAATHARPSAVAFESSSVAGTSRTRRTLGLVSIGAGAVAIGAGTYFGLQAAAHWNDFKKRCDPTQCADLSARGLYDDAKSYSTASTVLFTVGAAAAATGLILWLTGQSAEAVVTPAWFPAGGGVATRVRW